MFKIIKNNFKDPAPSKFKYRLNRIFYKKAKKFLLSIIFSIVFLYFYIDKDKFLDLAMFFQREFKELKTFVKQRHSPQVSELKIISENANLILKVNSILNFEFPTSSFDIDVLGVKNLIEEINAVEFANVRITSDGVLEIFLKERRPVIVHKLKENYFLLDKNGVQVDQIFYREDRNDLPLIVGEGVEKKVEESLQILIESEFLITRVRALVRIGNRRWNIFLDNNQFILLPEKNPLEALKKVKNLALNYDIFQKNIEGIDLRNQNFLILRLNEKNFDQKNKFRKLFSGEEV